MAARALRNCEVSQTMQRQYDTEGTRVADETSVIPAVVAFHPPESGAEEPVEETFVKRSGHQDTLPQPDAVVMAREMEWFGRFSGQTRVGFCSLSE
jgi:hypothetical protein